MSVRAPIASQVISLERLKELQDAADSIYVDRSVAQYAIDLVQATRHPDVSASTTCRRRSVSV